MGDAEQEELERLYEDLRQFAPKDNATELAQLAERLKELGVGSTGSEPAPVESIWERVAKSFGDDTGV